MGALCHEFKEKKGNGDMKKSLIINAFIFLVTAFIGFYSGIKASHRISETYINDIRYFSETTATTIKNNQRELVDIQIQLKNLRFELSDGQQRVINYWRTQR